MYSAGRCVLAPDGKWENTKVASNSNLEAIVEVNPVYFKKSEAISSVNMVKLVPNKWLHNSLVSLSDVYESWEESHTIAKIPVGTKAIILETKSEAMGNEELIRYKIKVNYKGKNYVGWVNSEDIAK